MRPAEQETLLFERKVLTIRSSPSLLHSPMRLPGLLTLDPGLLTVCDQIERLAPTAACVMLLGESGAGKELLARALHDRSARCDRRFVAINCAAIPEALLEGELFGDQHGAFDGGGAHHGAGKIGIADGGTLFLDEVGDLPLSMQPRLLRFLQDRLIERVGSRERVAVDVRMVCATHGDLNAMIAAGTFREDLYFRLAEMEVTIPPLRDRGGDAALLARTLVGRFAQQIGRPPMAVGADALQAIERHRWPGNVRELENAIRRAVIFAEGEEISADDLGIYWGRAADGADGERAGATAGAGAPAQAGRRSAYDAAGRIGSGFSLREQKENAQREAVAEALARTGGNIAGAARILGISRPTLYELLNRFGLR